MSNFHDASHENDAIREELSAILDRLFGEASECPVSGEENKKPRPRHMEVSESPAESEADDFSDPDDEEHASLIFLTDQNGVEYAFEVLDFIELWGDFYAVLLPADEEDADEAVVLKQVPAPNLNEEAYRSATEEEANAVYAIFMERSGDRFNFVE